MAHGLKFEIPPPKVEKAKLQIPLPESEEPGAPQVSTEEMISIELGIPYSVKGTGKAIVDAKLTGNTATLPEGFLVSVDMTVGDQEKKEEVKLTLDAFTSTKATFSKPVEAGTFIPVRNEFVVHSGKPGKDAVPATALSFTDTFGSAK